MTPLIDLMPESSRRKLGQRRRARRWALAYTGTLALLALSVALIGLVERSRAQEVARLRSLVDLDEEQRAHAEIISAEITKLRERFERHERLALPVTQSDLLSIVGGVMPDSVTLTSIAVSPRRDRARMPHTNSAAQPLGRLAVEIRGVAENDIQVAELFAGLDRHPLFASITIDYSQPAEVRGRAARKFGVSSEIDLDASYYIATGEETP